MDQAKFLHSNFLYNLPGYGKYLYPDVLRYLILATVNKYKSRGCGKWIWIVEQVWDHWFVVNLERHGIIGIAGCIIGFILSVNDQLVGAIFKEKWVKVYGRGIIRWTSCGGRKG